MQAGQGWSTPHFAAACRRMGCKAHLSVLVDKVDLDTVSIDAFARDVPCLPALVLVGEPDARIGRERVDELAALRHSRGKGWVELDTRLSRECQSSVRVRLSVREVESTRRVQEPTNPRRDSLLSRSRAHSRLFREPVDHTLRKLKSLSSRPCSSPARLLLFLPLRPVRVSPARANVPPTARDRSMAPYPT